jgi:uncharacterized protein YceK
MNLKWLIVAILLIAVAASGCGDKDTTTIETDEGQTVEVTTDQDNQDDWCAVGTSWKMSDPKTGQEASWEITGSEVIDGVEMCKAEYNTNNPDDEVAKMEWMWSEDNERVSWIYYNATGDVVYKMETKDGKTTIVDENGQVTEFESSQ